MPYNSLREFINELDRANELIRIREFVSPQLEITEITDRICKSANGGKALLFENNGTKFPLLINAFGSTQRMCKALGTKSFDDIITEFEKYKELLNPKKNFLNKLKLLPQLNDIMSLIPEKVNCKAPCHEIVMQTPDLTKLPILKCWPADGGNFITLPLVHTVNPITMQQNLGMYRMQVINQTTTAMHWHRHKGGAQHFNLYKKNKMRMPVAVALGGDPIYTYCATAPLPENINEYILAGFLRKKRIQLVKCKTNDLYVPLDVDFVIEGFIDHDEEFYLEGPFGDHTGFYSLPDYFPKFHITCITHRNDAIYPATIVGIPPMEDTYLAKATERIFLMPMKTTLVPELIDINLPQAGVAHNLCIAKIQKQYPGHALKVAHSLWGAGQMMFNKIIIITDENSDIHNYFTLAQIVSKNCIPKKDVHFSAGPLDELDHAANTPVYGGKLCIDATEQKLTPISLAIFEKQTVKNLSPNIIEINDDLVKKNIAVIIISFKKNQQNNIFNFSEKLVNSGLLNNIKFIVYTDAEVPIYNIDLVAWIVMNNIDATRDCFVMENTLNNASHLIIDGTTKSKHIDNFKRDWPNIVTMNQETIDAINKKWDSLGLGSFIESPSVSYAKLVKNTGAIKEKNTE